MSEIHPFAFPVHSASDESAWMASQSGEVREHAFPTTGTAFTPPANPAGMASSEGPPIESSPPIDVPLIDPAKEAQALARLEDQQHAYMQAAADLAMARSRIMRDLEAQVLNLAVDIAQALVEDELESKPELHQALARAAIETLGDPHNAELLAAPEAFETLVGFTGEPFMEVDGVRVPLRADPQLSGLGCIARNETGQVDGRVRERLRAVRQAFMDNIATQPEEEVE